MKSPLKVVHIVENLDKGAVENWLVRMFCLAKEQKTDLDWTFFCAVGKPGRLDRLVENKGGKIIYSKFPLSNKRAFVSSLRHVLKAEKFDVLHCHHDFISAVYLIAARGLGIPERIVHVHNADEVIPVGKVWKQNLIRPIFHRICLRYATKIVGISNHTLDQFLRHKRRRASRDKIHYYGVSPTQFAQVQRDKGVFLKELELPTDSLLLLFVGRMAPAKNPLFALEVLSALEKIEPRIAGVFVGAGRLIKQAEQKAKEIGIEKVRFLGWRNDIPQIMINSDLFISPHVEFPKEGLGLVIVEAQLAGLPLLLSKGICQDPLFKEAVFTQLKLADGPEIWAREALQLMKKGSPSSPAMITAMQSTPFDMEFAVNDLIKLYE